MFNLQQFIADHVICRPTSMFAADIEANKETLQAEIRNKSVCVIGGAGSIGSSFIKAVLPFKPSKLIVIDLNENGLAELTRDLRSTYGMYVPAEYRAYTLNFADPIFERIFREEKGFDIVANFSAHKHVRSEKDKYSVQALIENNDIKAIKDLMATQLAKICIPPFNREYLLLNAYLKLKDDKQIDTQVNNIMDHVPMNSKQKSALAKSVFYIYVDKKNASMIDRLLEMVSTTNDHALYRQMDMVNDTLISGGIKYYDELKSDLEDEEYTKNNEDTPYLEFLLSIIYKNMGNESKSKEYKNKALEDSKGTVYESLIKSQN